MLIRRLFLLGTTKPNKNFMYVPNCIYDSSDNNYRSQQNYIKSTRKFQAKGTHFFSNMRKHLASLPQTTTWRRDS